jgi:hypothetical protein
MADVYGVLAADVAAELPGLFAVGFTQATKPTLATVTAWITDADTFIDTVVQAVIAVVPDYAETASKLAKRYVIDAVVARIYRATYAGRAAPADIAALGDGGESILTQLRALPTQAAELTDLLLAAEAAAATKVAVPYTTPERDLIIDTVDLDPNSGYRGRF